MDQSNGHEAKTHDHDLLSVDDVPPQEPDVFLNEEDPFEVNFGSFDSP